MIQDKNLAILWDLDGTIIDSKECHFNSWKAVFDRYGFPFNRDLYENNFGRNNQAAIRVYLNFEPEPELVETISREKEIIFRENVVAEARLVPGVKTWLEQARAREIPQVIASSAPLENIDAILEGFQLASFFSDCVSGADLPAKPEPDVFLQAMHILGMPADRCLVIEDSVPGILAAKQANLACIAVATSWNQAALTSADLVIQDFTYPLDLALQSLFKR